MVEATVSILQFNFNMYNNLITWILKSVNIIKIDI